MRKIALLLTPVLKKLITRYALKPALELRCQRLRPNRHAFDCRRRRLLIIDGKLPASKNDGAAAWYVIGEYRLVSIAGVC